MQTDNYRTIETISEGIYKEKGSKFIAYAFPVTCEEDIKTEIDKLKKEYYDARHHCYAYILGADKKDFRANDDGEPSSTAGKPILGQILSSDLTNILIVVVRYFGGTKLGVSGLIHAYKTAAFDAISNAEIIEKTVNDIYDIHFDYLVMNDVMRIIKEEEPLQIDQDFNLTCKITLSIRQSEVEKIIERFNKIDSIKLDHIRTE
ncbi:YigZ family protein [Ancylomarina euxinus]|uniref:YigZ family protein n=1 Tax=Ancylomarina euxinus TaxID=2283627 RepID=A0A425XXE5_9BACT|nr:YigZ family protein [Ancylomarina euxinus]MCZ4696097.1 YigZ family protein [Ancylomarina euxinus]MUP16506.1 YigZ family protein [Ancylomarina euxinus]RRG19343.1 YigZ family protein [Ancylomarina euxinus]